jgi:hypothetical protein
MDLGFLLPNQPAPAPAPAARTMKLSRKLDDPPQLCIHLISMHLGFSLLSINKKLT